MKKVFLLMSIFLSCYNIYSTEISTDSIQKYITQSKDNTLSNEDRISNAKEAINLARKSNKDTLINKSLLNYAHVTLNLSKYIETIKILQNAIDSCNFENDSVQLGIMINTQGVAFGELSQNSTAIRYFKNALKIFKQIGYNKGKFQALNNIGLLYYYNNDYKKAKKYFLDIIKNDKDIHKDNEAGSIYLNLGNIYVNEENYKKGKYYYNKILNNKENTKPNLYCIALNGLSELYKKLGNIDEAYKIIIKTKQLLNVSPKYQQVVCVETTADILMEMDSINSAKALYTYALRYAEKLDLVDKRISILKKQASLYKQINKQDKSYKLLIEAITLIDSVSFSEVVKNSKLQEEFFLHEQEKYNLMKEKNKIEQKERISQMKLNKQKIWLIILISIFILLLILIIMVIKNHKNKIKYLNETNKLKLDYQMEVATQLETEVNHKIEQFTEVALILSHQNLFLKDLKKNLDKIKNRDYPQIMDIKIRLSSVIKANEEKEVFYNAIENINNQIINDLKENHPNITDNDIRLICLSKLNLSNKEVSSLIGTSVKNIEMAKYRLKKKLNLDKDDSIEDLI